MDDDARRGLRTRLSAALLLGGGLTFVGSLALPAVRMWHPSYGRIEVDGWTAATNYGPTAGTNGFLVLAFAFWGAAHWFRSPWALWVGRAAAVAAFLLHALIGAWPAFEGIEVLRSGYWTWLAASAVTAAAFVALPPPVRPPPGEPLPRGDIDRGRTGLATIVGAAAIVTILVSHLFVPTTVASRTVRGPVPADAPSEYYQSGPTRSRSGAFFRPRALADGSTVDEEWHHEHEWAPLVLARFGSAGTGATEFALLALPLVFVAAAATRRAAWRWTGAGLSAAAAVAAFAWAGTPWSCSGITPHPLDVVWQAPPCALTLAFLVLPPRR